MCGIAGFLISATGFRESPDAVLDAMVASLEHRGPDEDGVWKDPDAGIFLGFRRLSILDLSRAGHQPMISRSGRYVVTFNGEIYNFSELRAILEADSSCFRGGSDTEVLLAAVERWGVEGALRRFRGMFAFALWDREERRLFLARDRLGIKPLYLLNEGDGLAWASECRAFHPFPLYSGQGSREAAWHFLQRLYVPAPMSILAGVEKLPAGTVASFELRGGRLQEVRRQCYWDLTSVAEGAVDSGRDSLEVVDHLLDLLRETVRIHLRSDVPVGALLSGGVDSAVVVALMQEVATDPVRTFTISFDDPDYDEAPVAKAVATHLGTDHTSIAFSTTDVLGLIPELPRLSDEPMANPSLLPTVLVSRVARRDVVVALSGDGGDELFGGYNRYVHGAGAIRRLHRLPQRVRRGLAAATRTTPAVIMAEMAFRWADRGRLGRQHSPRERMEKLARLLDATDEWRAYEGLLQAGMREPPMKGRVQDPPPAEFFGTWDAPLESRMMLLDQLGYLPDDLLAKVDRASMWESLEVRVPLLDHEVVEFSWSIPSSMKIRKGVSKWPLRQIASRYLPAPILDRPKMGFTVPIARWLATHLRTWARDVLSTSNARTAGLWDEQGLERLWKAFEAGRHDLALPLYAAAVLQSWSESWNVSFE